MENVVQKIRLEKLRGGRKKSYVSKRENKPEMNVRAKFFYAKHFFILQSQLFPERCKGCDLDPT